MIHLADDEFLRRVADIPDDASVRVRHKKALMIEVVLKGRRGLKTKSSK